MEFEAERPSRLWLAPQPSSSLPSESVSGSNTETEPEVDPMRTLRHPSLYFEQGDIALSAKDSDTLTYIFRVYRLFLTHHSEVFKAIIESLGSEGSVEEYDGVPLVTLSEEDQAAEVANLLEVIHDPSALPRQLGIDNRADIPRLSAGLLEISIRYKVQPIVTTIKEHIRKEWPTTLGGWEVRQLEMTKSPYYDLLPEPVSAIQFATTYELPSILPAAFYLLAITPTKRDWNDHQPPNINAARWFSLSDSNAVRFAKGRDAMLEFYLSEAERDLAPQRDTYGWTTGPDRYHCTCDFDPLKLELKLLAVSHHLDCLKGLQNLMDRCEHRHKFCLNCMIRMHNHFRRVRTEVWKKLPDFFIVKEDGHRLTWNTW